MGNEVNLSMTSLAGVISMTVLLVGGVVGWWSTIRSDRRAARAQDRTEVADEVNVVVQLSKGYAELQALQVKTWGEAQAARVKADTVQRVADTARAEVESMRIALGSFVRPILRWIDSGAVPPPPEIHPELRRIVEQIEHPTTTPTGGEAP